MRRRDQTYFLKLPTHPLSDLRFMPVRLPFEVVLTCLNFYCHSVPTLRPTLCKRRRLTFARNRRRAPLSLRRVWLSLQTRYETRIANPPETAVAKVSASRFELATLHAHDPPVFRLSVITRPRSECASNSNSKINREIELNF